MPLLEIKRSETDEVESIEIVIGDRNPVMIEATRDAGERCWRAAAWRHVGTDDEHRVGRVCIAERAHEAIGQAFAEVALEHAAIGSAIEIFAMTPESIWRDVDLAGAEQRA
jgi:hypothetical protein